MILMNECSVEVVEALIGDLLGRRGFDGWWHGIDRCTKDEVIEELAAVVRATIKRNAEAHP